MSFETKWNSAVAAKIAKGMTRRAAVLATAAEDPKLHADFLAEHNNAHGRAFGSAMIRSAQ